MPATLPRRRRLVAGLVLVVVGFACSGCAVITPSGGPSSRPAVTFTGRVTADPSQEPTSAGPSVQVSSDTEQGPWQLVPMGDVRLLGRSIPYRAGIIMPARRGGASCLAIVEAGSFQSCLEDSELAPHPHGTVLGTNGENVVAADAGTPEPRAWMGGDYGDAQEGPLGTAAEAVMVTDADASDDDFALFGSVRTAACPTGQLTVWVPSDTSFMRVGGNDGSCVPGRDRAGVVGAVRDGSVVIVGAGPDGRPDAWVAGIGLAEWRDATWSRWDLPARFSLVTDVTYEYAVVVAGAHGTQPLVLRENDRAPVAVGSERLDPHHPVVLVADDGFVSPLVVALQGPVGPRVCTLRARWSCVDGPSGTLVGASVDSGDTSPAAAYLTIRRGDTVGLWWMPKSSLTGAS